MRNKNNKHLGIEIDPALHISYIIFQNITGALLTVKFCI